MLDNLYSVSPTQKPVPCLAALGWRRLQHPSRVTWPLGPTKATTGGLGRKWTDIFALPPTDSASRFIRSMCLRGGSERFAALTSPTAEDGKARVTADSWAWGCAWGCYFIGRVVRPWQPA